MNFYEVAVKYCRQTGEDNPGTVKEHYLVEALSPADAEKRVIEEIKPFVFNSECEFTSIKKRRFFDIVSGDKNDDTYYACKVELIKIDGDQELRKAVSILVHDSYLIHAAQRLNEHLNTYDADIISVSKSPILDIFRATNP